MISVIVPMYNSSAYIDECLTALTGQTEKDLEVILVDDCSRDDTVGKARKYPFKIIELKQRLFPGQVRNYGAKNSSGGILLFLDADILLKPDSVERIKSRVLGPATDLFFGSYTRNTPAAGYFSRFQNLISAFRYSKLPQTANFTLSHFCAIKRDVFESVGGYNEKMFYYEDIELGNRLTRKGYLCKCDPGLEVTHLKTYSHSSLVSEYFRKAAAMAGYLKDKDLFAGIKYNGWPFSLKAAAVSSLALLTSFFLIKSSFAFFIFSLSAYFIFVSPFLWYTFRDRGPYFALKSFFVIIEVFTAAFAGMAAGLFSLAR